MGHADARTAGVANSVYNECVIKDSLGIGPQTSARAAAVALLQAPERFLGDAWSKLVALKGSEDQALYALDHPDSGWVVYYRRGALSHGAPSVQFSQQAQEREEIYRLTEMIIEGLRNLGAEGRLIATGLYVGAGLRQDIPSDLWAKAKIEFAAGGVTSGKFEYHAVTMREPKKTADEDGLIEAIRAWIDNRRRQHGEEKKRALREAAREAFGDAFTVRAFNAAYTAAYGRKRGRPKKRNK